MCRRVMIPSLATLVAACTPFGPEPETPEQAFAPDPKTAPIPEGTPSNGETDQPQDPGRPPVASQSAGSLTVELVPRFDTVLAGTSGEIDILIRMTGAETPDAPSPPLDLALVVDRSGSMAGEKLSAVKQAAIETLGQLDDDDRITFVAYDDVVDVHARRTITTKSAKLGIRRSILALTDRGGTALGPALKAGIDNLRGKSRNPDALAHVMLLSDGLANEGEQNPAVLAGWASQAFGDGVAISTLGVGVDYNEDLMTRIADAGGGRYHFIEKGEDVPRILADEFAGLTSTVARNLSMGIEPASGVIVEDVLGYPTTTSGKNVTAKVGSVSAGKKRELLARLNYEAPKGSSMALGTFTIQYRDALADGEPRELVFHPVLSVTSDPDAVQASEHVEVTVRAHEFEAARAMEAASRHIEQGQFQMAEDLLRTQKAELEKKAEEHPSPEMDALVQEVEEAEKGVDKAKSSQYERQKYQKDFKSKAYMRRKK